MAYFDGASVPKKRSFITLAPARLEEDSC
jgi:hypothetical protein